MISTEYPSMTQESEPQVNQNNKPNPVSLEHPLQEN